MTDAKPPENPRNRARRVFKEMRANVRSFEQSVLKLVRHPDATQAQLADVHTSYVAVWNSYMDTKAKLREKFPPRTFCAVEPWDQPE